MRRSPGLLGVLLVAILAGLGSSGAWADAEQSFKKGLEASDQQDWSEAARHFRQAVADDGQESPRRVFISGVFSSPYLPHFYLGWALYRWNPQNCSESLQSWSTSTQQGVVQTFRRQYQDLQSGRQACLDELLPTAMSGANVVLRQGRSRLQELVDAGIVDVADAQDVRQSIETLETRLAQADASKDLQAIRQIIEEGEGVTQELEQRRAAASAQSDRRLENAGLQARRALGDAERAERQVLALLADPTYAAARRALPGEGMSASLEARLEAVRAAASQASQLDEFQAVEAEANSIAEALETSRLRLRGLFDAELRRRAVAPPPPSVDSAATPPPPPAPPVDDPTPEPIAEDVVPALLRTQADDLLSWVEGASPSPLMTLQAQRLRGLLDGSTYGATPPDDIRQRLDASMGALQLLAAGHAFLRGEPQQTLRWIDLRPLPDADWTVHGHLFAAAARFRLYRQGGEREVDLLEAARDGVLHSRGLSPNLEPDGDVFSPAFRHFFEQVTVTTETTP